MKLIYYILIGVVIGILIVPALRIYIPYHQTESLRFTMDNFDTSEHLVRVEIFNSQMVCIFNQTYSVNPGTEISSPKIIRKKGNYLFKISMDDTHVKSFEAGVSFAHSTVEIELFGFNSGELEPIYIVQGLY